MKYVSYEDIREKIKDGDVVFMKGKWTRPAHALIMIFTKSQLYHVGVAFWMNTKAGERLMLVEATGKSQRRVVNLSYYSDHKLVVVDAVKSWETIEERALETIGETRYGFIEAAYIGIREATSRWFGWKLPARDLPYEVCSSYVASLLDLEDKIISPQTLYDKLTKIKKGA
mgnify:CR=1 FL=1